MNLMQVNCAQASSSGGFLSPLPSPPASFTVGRYLPSDRLDNPPPLWASSMVGGYLPSDRLDSVFAPPPPPNTPPPLSSVLARHLVNLRLSSGEPTLQKIHQIEMCTVLQLPPPDASPDSSSCFSTIAIRGALFWRIGLPPFGGAALQAWKIMIATECMTKLLPPSSVARIVLFPVPWECRGPNRRCGECRRGLIV